MFSKDSFAADVDRSKCLHATSSNALFCKHYTGYVNYHKFSHNDISYRFNGENVNVMLESMIKAHSYNFKIITAICLGVLMF